MYTHYTEVTERQVSPRNKDMQLLKPGAISSTTYVLTKIVDNILASSSKYYVYT